MHQPLDIVILGLSITSSWGNGHATTYRSLVRALSARGHRVTFLERDVPWYAAARDLPRPPYGKTDLYDHLDELRDVHQAAVRAADLVIVGSFVVQGVDVARWVQQTTRGLSAFYDIDTPVTLAKLARGDHEYLTPELIPHFDLYLSFTGGPTLELLQQRFGAPLARPLYCSVDPDLYYPRQMQRQYALGYMGTYSDDRQPKLERLLLEPARQYPELRFAVAGSQFPAGIVWPDNVQRIEHLQPAQHGCFYNEQRITLNITRAEMVRAGYAPSVRLFEAAACGTPIISDGWEGLNDFFMPGREILVAETAEDVVQILRRTPDEQLQRIAQRARRRVLDHHTAAQRAAELEQYVEEASRRRRPVHTCVG
jgi:spore maturation protein CgeB